MDNDYVNLPSQETSPSPLTWRDAAAPVFALGLSILFWAVFALEHFANYGPGLGVPVYVLAYYAAVLILLGRRACWNRGSMALASASLLLAVCCTLYALPVFLILNCFLVLVTAAMATFILSGQAKHSPREAVSLLEAAWLSLLALLSDMNKPFQAAKRLRGRGRGAAGRVAAAVAAAVPVVCVVLWLLSSADPVFAGVFAGLLRWLAAIQPGPLAWRLFRAAIVALLIASGLYFIQEDAPVWRGTPGKTEKQRHALPFLVVTVLLDGIYILFCAIQITYLFGGREAASMAGGWAAYAREGFFQLVAVAVINLGLCLLGTDKRRFAAWGGLALRLADGLMLALTALMLLSALRRMQLYIAAFGLSVLRLMTLWGMLVIAAGLLAAGWKLYRPDFSFFSLLGGFALGTWCLMCLCNPGGAIARYNVNAYLEGRLESVDVYYLEQLTTDALGALYKLEAQTPDDERLSHVIRSLEDTAENTGRWTQWKASFLRARR